jgi:asparagine synthase (glutamine-hydrolysing)
MCGITGFIGWKQNSSTLLEVISSMSNQIRHRGPDSSGAWVDESDGVALAHNRLSILDLSEAGNQPMKSDCGRFILIFNGEIYNHLSIRGELKSHHWRSRTDTETLLTAISHWGLENALKKCVGMFAFALWDRSKKKLLLARDRAGEKPLYYSIQGDKVLFSSELKALRKHPKFDNEIDKNSVADFICLSYIPGPGSIYRNAKKLSPGTFIEFQLGNNDLTITSHGEQRYWTPKSNLSSCPHSYSLENSLLKLDEILSSSVKLQMLADVPIGSFLSGGIDSSIVTCLMQQHSDKPINTYSIGFHDQDFNEASYAKSISDYLGCNHHELYVTSQDARDAIPLMAQIYDEPFADQSQIPTFLLSKLAASDIKVALSGDGADELFAGYNRHIYGKKLWERIDRLHPALRNFLSRVLDIPSSSTWNFLTRIQPKKNAIKNLGTHAKKLSSLVAANSQDEFFMKIVSTTDAHLLLKNNYERRTSDLFKINDPSLFTEEMLRIDFNSYLCDDVLVKVDRSTMFNSIESRAPFLDHRLIEFANNLPISLKIHDGQGKWILRMYLETLLPKKLFDRPKMGFGAPIAGWLRGPLKDWANELLSHEQINRYDLLNSDRIQLMWKQHLNGVGNWEKQLWNILMLQSWLNHNQD